MKKCVEFMGMMVNSMGPISCECELLRLRVRSGLDLKAMIQSLLLPSLTVLDSIVPLFSCLPQLHLWEPTIFSMREEEGVLKRGISRVKVTYPLQGPRSEA